MWGDLNVATSVRLWNGKNVEILLQSRILNWTSIWKFEDVIITSDFMEKYLNNLNSHLARKCKLRREKLDSYIFLKKRIFCAIPAYKSTNFDLRRKLYRTETVRNSILHKKRLVRYVQNIYCWSYLAKNEEKTAYVCRSFQ